MKSFAHERNDFDRRLRANLRAYPHSRVGKHERIGTHSALTYGQARDFY